MRKKLFSLLFVMLAVLLVLGSCNGATPPTETASDTGAGSSDPAQTEPPVSKDNGVAELTALDALNAAVENSHATADTNAYLEADKRSYIELSSATTGQSRYNYAQYPRVKQLKDGSYIMFWQYGTYGQHIYYALSRDLVSWEAPQVLYNSAHYKYTNAAGEEVRKYFVNPDAAVLDNGDILVVVSFRESKDYKNKPEMAGIYARRSTNGGKTWEDPVQIYTGVNWEPSILQLSNGDIQVFFTQVSPGISYWGNKTDRNSTGTAMVYSKDGGKTWLPQVTSSPWQAQLVAQQYIMDVEESPSFTDQMSVVTELYDGSLALACESKMVDKSFRISMVYSDDPEWETVAYDQTGPSDRQNNLYTGAGPYIITMPSGETVLTYGISSRSMVLRVGSGDARTFGDEYTVFRAPGYWGSIEATGNNRVTAVFPWIKQNNGAQQNSIMLQNLYLNHSITAEDAEIVVNGKNSEDWAKSTDAWFVGSESQAQLTLRTAKSEDMLYLLAERRDNSLAAGDCSHIYIADTLGSYYTFAIDENGNVTAKKGYADNTTAISDFTSASTVIANEGIVTEICIDLAALGLSGRSGYLVYPVLVNCDANGTNCIDTVSGTEYQDPTTWLTVKKAGMENGSAPLGAGGTAPNSQGGPQPDAETPQSVYSFFRESTVKTVATDAHGVQIDFDKDEICLGIRVSDNYDPRFSLVYGELNTDAYNYMLVRYRVTENAGGNSSLGFFIAAGDMQPFTYTAQSYISGTLIKDGEWHTMVLNIADCAYFNGVLKTLRIDPFDGSNANVGDGINIAWIAFADTAEKIIPYM